MDAHTLYWIMRGVQLGSITLLLLGWLWYFRLTAGRDRTLRGLLLLIATISNIWFLLPDVFLGPSYSAARLAIIDVNSLTMLICSIAAFVSKGKRKILLGLACLATAWLWAVAGAINVTV